MNKEDFEKLLEGRPKEILAKGILLFNGTAKCAQEYQSSPTSVNRRNWEDSAAALKKFTDGLSAPADTQDQPLDDLAECLKYLTAEGWKVTRTSLYRHHKEGKLAPRPDGTYALRDVDRYAKSWLKEKSTGKRVGEAMEELQRRKLQLEIANQELENKRKSLAYDKDLDRFVPRELMEIELATRAGILDAGLKHWVQSHAAEWIRMADGDTKKVGDVINLMNRDLDEHINSYARPQEYQVIIDAEEDQDSEPPEIEEENQRC